VVQRYTVGMLADGAGHDWRSIWLFPAIMSVVILVLFLFTFSDRTKSRGERTEQVAELSPQISS